MKHISRSPLISFISLFLILFLLDTGCNKPPGEKPHKESVGREEKTISQPAEHFTITIGSGGGFTGAFQGYTFYSDGKVEYWQRYGAKQDSIMWTTEVEPEQLETFQQRLAQSGMLEKTIQEKGNMTTMVTYDTPDTSYYWTWDEQTEIPPAFNKWYDDVHQFFDQLRTEK